MPAHVTPCFRSPRSRAVDLNASANFDTTHDQQDPLQGVPPGAPGYGQKYADATDALHTKDGDAERTTHPFTLD